MRCVTCTKRFNGKHMPNLLNISGLIYFLPKKIISIASLTAKLESFILSEIKQLHNSTKKYICRKQKSELGGSVQNFSDDKGKLLMVPECDIQGCCGRKLDPAKRVEDFEMEDDRFGQNCRSDCIPYPNNHPRI